MVIYVIATLLRPMRGREAGLAPETTPLVQARSQKFAMGGLFAGSGGEAPNRRRPMGAGGLGAKPPATGGTGVWGLSPQRSKILHFFCENNFILGLF